MEYTGYLDFWFTDRPMVERVEPMVQAGSAPRGCAATGVASRWPSWPRNAVVSGAVINSTFDDQMGSMADPGDNDLTYRSWAESLEMACRYGVEHLYLFSNQVDLVNDKTWSRRVVVQFLAG